MHYLRAKHAFLLNWHKKVSVEYVILHNFVFTNYRCFMLKATCPKSSFSGDILNYIEVKLLEIWIQICFHTNVQADAESRYKQNESGNCFSADCFWGVQWWEPDPAGPGLRWGKWDGSGESMVRLSLSNIFLFCSSRIFTLILIS